MGHRLRQDTFSDQNDKSTDEQGDPLYEDIGPTPRFLALSRKYLQSLVQQQDSASH